MPFKSEKQRKWMHANDPKMAKKWEKKKKMKEKTRVKELIKKMVREIMAEIVTEDFAGAHPKGKREKFDKMRQKQSEVLGYKLMGTPDVKTEIGDATIKEGFQKRHFLNLIKKELKSIKGQKAYCQDALRQKDIEKWEKKEFEAVWEGLVKREKELKIHYRNIKLMKDSYNPKGITLWELTEAYVNEGKWKVKGKYLITPTGETTSIPGNNDRDAILVDTGWRDTWHIYIHRGKLRLYNGKTDKFFKNTKDLIKWLNKNKAKYVGIDNR